MTLGPFLHSVAVRNGREQLVWEQDSPRGSSYCADQVGQQRVPSQRGSLTPLFLRCEGWLEAQSGEGHVCTSFEHGMPFHFLPDVPSCFRVG